MINYQTVRLADIMPENLLADENVRACCEAIDGELNKVAKLCSEVLLISRIDELSEEVIDLLAWQWHVDFYDSGYDLETKRKLVKQSIDWHRRKGTPSVVREVVSAVLENAVVSENWEYGGQPYCFNVRLISGEMPDKETLAKLVKDIREVKNTRSHLDEVSFYREIEGRMHVGASLASTFKYMCIGLPKFKAPQVRIKHSFGVGSNIYKNLVIGKGD